MALALDLTYLISIWLEVLLYGMFVPIFGLGIYEIIERVTRGQRLNVGLTSVSLVMFVIATAHLSLNATRLLIAFVWERDAPGGPVAFLGNISQPTQVTKDVLYIIQSLAGDAFAIYRVWVIWDRRWTVIILPISLFVACVVTTTVGTYLFTKIPIGETIFDSTLYQWVLSFYSMSFIQNVITTSLLAYRIWSSEHNLIRANVSKRTSLMGVVRIFVESAVMYVIWQLALLVLYATEDPSQYIILESYPAVVGIVFMSIIVRIGIRMNALQRQNATTGLHIDVPLDRIVVTRHQIREEDASTREAAVAANKENDEGEGSFTMQLTTEDWQN